MLSYNGYSWGLRIHGRALVLKFSYNSQYYYQAFTSLSAVAAFIDDNIDCIRGDFRLL
jgi:hypothetical protein